jgi:hypothetical protein
VEEFGFYWEINVLLGPGECSSVKKNHMIWRKFMGFVELFFWTARTLFKNNITVNGNPWTI